MGGLELKYLGEFEVLRDGEVVPLPPSKKTRALLAWLSLNPRRFRREFLCELLWEIPDDPRGSLRWSLSKLRRMVDDEQHRRIVADRNSVEFDPAGVRIDVTDLVEIANNGLSKAPVDVLEGAVALYRGNFLEGLELSNFHEFHAWCVAEREQAARTQASILRELVDRLADDQERALPFARSLVSLSPYDESSRALLIRLLVNLRRHEEAEQQYRLGLKMLDEVGAEPGGELHAAWRGTGTPPTSTAQKDNTMAVRVHPMPGPATGLVGRSGQIATLASLFAETVEEGSARFAVVRGEPGIGKSSIIDTVCALARESGACLITAGAYESEAIRPFAMWIDALAQWDSDAVKGIFGAEDTDNRDRLFDGLSAFISQEAVDRPVVLVFDDIHWCDESSAAALHYVGRMNRNRPVLAVLGARESELRDNVAVQQLLRGLAHDRKLTEIKLGPLSETEILELIRPRAPETEVGRLSRECGGNPLLAIELARAEREGGSGNSLDELIRERLERLDVEGAEVLRWASVLSPRIDISRLVELTRLDSDRVGVVLETAERQAMLKSTTAGLQFSHDLIARGVYTDISPVRRQVMHHRIAKMLELNTASDLEYAADLAHHATQSGDTALAASALASAGRLCLRFFANDEALSLSRRGLQLADQLGEAERVSASIDLHDVRLSAAPLDDWEAAAGEYAVLAEQALDHGDLAHARLGYQMASYVRWAHGQWSGAREESLQAERVARGSSIEEHIIGMAETAKCLILLERDLSQANAMLMEARGLAARERFIYHGIPAGLGMLHLRENDLDKAGELFKEARMLCKSAGDRVTEFQANEFLVMIELQRSRYREASTHCDELIRIGDKLREGSEGPFAHALRGLCNFARGEDSASLESALERLRLVDAKHRLAYTLTRIALLDIARDRNQDAITRASEALECAAVLERPTEMLLAHAVLEHAYRALDMTSEADEHARASAELDSSRVSIWANDIAADLSAEGK